MGFLIIGLLLSAVVVGVGAESYKVLSYARTETEHRGLHLSAEAMWYKVPAMDVIEGRVTLLTSDHPGSNLCPAFYLMFPDGTTTTLPNIPAGDVCLGEVDSIAVKFYIWCHDLGGWCVFVFDPEKRAFQKIGKTESDFPVGEWVVIVVDRETGEKVAGVPLFVDISKPRGVGKLTQQRMS